MNQDYYIASDNSSMEIEDFISYIHFLDRVKKNFIFEEWFSQEDFSSEEVYNFIKKIVSK